MLKMFVKYDLIILVSMMNDDDDEDDLDTIKKEIKPWNNEVSPILWSCWFP